MIELFANSGDAADLGLHCLPITLLSVSRLQWVYDADKNNEFLFQKNKIKKQKKTKKKKTTRQEIK